MFYRWNSEIPVFADFYVYAWALVTIATFAVNLKWDNLWFYLHLRPSGWKQISVGIFESWNVSEIFIVRDKLFSTHKSDCKDLLSMVAELWAVIPEKGFPINLMANGFKQNWVQMQHNVFSTKFKISFLNLRSNVLKSPKLFHD